MIHFGKPYISIAYRVKKKILYHPALDAEPISRGVLLTPLDAGRQNRIE